MTRYVALIRGIGPGDPRKSNASLREVLESLGLTDVRSVISSGNVIFSAEGSTSAAVGDLIEEAWPRLKGFTATTIVLSYDELRVVVEALPFGDLSHGRESYQLVTFSKRPVPLTATPPPELALRVAGVAAGALCTVSDTTVAGTPDAMRWLEKTYSKEITSRTPGTLAKILKAMEKG